MTNQEMPVRESTSPAQATELLYVTPFPSGLPRHVDLPGRADQQASKGGITMLEFLRYGLFLVCPVMMILMMRHGHGHGGAVNNAGVGSSFHGSDPSFAEARLPLTELRRRSDELNAEIVLRELETGENRKAEQ